MSNRDFAPTELQLPCPEFKALADARRRCLDPVVSQWLGAWDQLDLFRSPMTDEERARLRYGHYLGWFDRQAMR